MKKILLLLCICAGLIASSVVFACGGDKTVYRDVIFCEGKIGDTLHHTAQTITVEDGQKVTPPNFAVEGYTLTWHTSATTQDSTTLFDFDSPITADISLFPKYIKILVNFDVTFSAGKIDDVLHHTAQTIPVEEGQKVTPPDFAVEGYTLTWHTSATMQDSTTLFDFNTLIAANITLYPKYTQDDLSVIRTVRNLKEINMDGQYTLAANLVLTDWTPLGTKSAPFEGTLDGCGFSITLSIDFSTLKMQPDSCYYGGLFAVNSGLIKNLVISKLTITGNNSQSTDERDKYYLGGFAGQNYGKIEKCKALDGNINVEALDNDELGQSKLRVGLISGWNGGIIKECLAIGEISTRTQASTNRVGGICGTNENGTVQYCAAKVDVSISSSTGNISAGGLVGYLEGSGILERSCGLGEVNALSESGTAYAGGLCGYVDATDKNTGWNYSFIYCYAEGAVYAQSTGNAYAGGLIARIENAALTVEIIVEDCYALGTVCAQATTESKNCYAAGLIGRIQLIDGSNILVKRCIAAGDVTSTQNAGNVRGSGDGTWEGCYYSDAQIVVSDSEKINSKGATAAPMDEIYFWKLDIFFEL